MTPTIAFVCPKCGGKIDATVTVSVENLQTVSMVMFTHQELLHCASCYTKFLIVIGAVDMNGIKLQAKEVIPQEQSKLILPN